MKLSNLDLPTHLPPLLKQELHSWLKPSEKPFVRSKLEGTHLKSTGASDTFIKHALQSGLKSRMLLILSALIFDERMAEVWKCLNNFDKLTSEPRPKQSKGKKPSSVDNNAVSFLKCAIMSFRTVDQAKRDREKLKADTDSLKKLLSKSIKIIQTHKPKIDKVSLLSPLNQAAFDRCFLNFEVNTDLRNATATPSNPISTIDALNRLIENADFYLSFRKNVLLTADDYALISRESGSRRALIRSFIGALKNHGFEPSEGKMVTLLIPSVVDTLLSPRAKNAPSNSVTEDDVRKALTAIEKHENNFYAEFGNLYSLIFDDFALIEYDPLIHGADNSGP